MAMAMKKGAIGAAFPNRANPLILFVLALVFTPYLGVE